MSKSPSREERAGETPTPLAWRENVIRELTRRKIPRAWQARLLEELDDHLSDLKEERMSTTAEQLQSPEDRLGVPHEIAAAAAAEYRKLGFFARRPVLTYFLLPIVAVPAAFVAFLLVAMPLLSLSLDGAAWLLGAESHMLSSSAANGLVGTVVLATRFVPFALLAWLFCLLARRHGRGWRCVLSACTVVAVYAALYSVTMQDRTEAQQGSLMMSLAIPPQKLSNILQAAVPLAVGLLFVWRMSAGRSSSSHPGSAITTSSQVAAG